MVVISKQSLRILDRSNADIKISNEREYKAAMKTIESLLNKATQAGGFHKLPDEEVTMRDSLSKLAEAYEDNILKLMPIVPRAPE